MPDNIAALDYHRLFETMPGLCVVILPDFTVAAVTNDYLRATMVTRANLIGRNLFDVFPANPAHDGTHGSADVRASLKKVFQTGVADELPILRYDVQRPAEQGGGFEERYWKLSTVPAVTETDEIPYVIHCVEDVSQQVGQQQKAAAQEIINAELRAEAARSDDIRRETELALKDAQLRLESALKAGEIGTWTWDVINDRVIADSSLARLFGVSAADANEARIETYLAAIHPDDAPTVKKLITEALAKGEAYEAEYRLKNPDGGYRQVLARGRVIRDRDGKARQLPGVVVDVTTARRTQQLLLERTRLATFSSDIGIALNRRDLLSSRLKLCTDAMVEHLDAAFARIWTLDQTSAMLELQASSGLYTHLDGAHARVPVGQFKIGRIAAQRQPHLSNDVLRDPELSDPAWAEREGMTAFAGYPLIVEDKLVGVMCIFARHVLTDAIVQAMATVSNIVANAIERKQVEDNLTASNERFELTTRATNDVIWDWNLQNDEVWWNNSVQSMFGYPPEQIGHDAKWWYEHIHPDDRARIVAGIHAVIDNGGENWSDEYRYLCADGSYKHVLDRGYATHQNGQPARMIGAMQDVTTRRAAETAIRDTQARLQLVLDASQLGLWYCDLPFDTLNWSDLTKEHFWLPPAATVTIGDFFNIIHPDDRQRTQTAIDTSIADHAPYNIEYRTVNPQDGRIKWICAIGRGFYDEAGTPYRFDGVTLDITDRKLIESEREQLLASEKDARAESEQANRMKDEFLATLSHELRTPLSAILGWSRMLNDGQLTADQSRRALETIERNARVQAQLIEDVLDVSRIISGKMRLEVRPVDLSAVIEGALDSVRPAAEAKEIRLQRVTDYDVMISGDADRLQQIVWNLLSNAIKFTPKGGRVQIRLERINSHVEITVADNGIGIDAENLPFVFERFRQSDSSTTRKHGGLGLGLAIVRHLVELHGGTVHAASAGLNQGTIFTVMFPLIALRSDEVPDEFANDMLARVHPTADDNKVGFACPPQIAGLRILVVDDEADTREMMAFIFKSCQAQVQVAASVTEALELIRSDKFDVLVSDIGMPERDGYELLKTVRALPAGQGGRIPAVALTAYARVEDRVRALNAGFQMHVPKPVEPAELLTVVANLADWNSEK